MLVIPKGVPTYLNGESLPSGVFSYSAIANDLYSILASAEAVIHILRAKVLYSPHRLSTVLRKCELPLVPSGNTA